MYVRRGYANIQRTHDRELSADARSVQEANKIAGKYGPIDYPSQPYYPHVNPRDILLDDCQVPYNNSTQHKYPLNGNPQLSYNANCYKNVSPYPEVNANERNEYTQKPWEPTFNYLGTATAPPTPFQLPSTLPHACKPIEQAQLDSMEKRIFDAINCYNNKASASPSDKSFYPNNLSSILRNNNGSLHPSPHSNNSGVSSFSDKVNTQRIVDLSNSQTAHLPQRDVAPASRSNQRKLSTDKKMRVVKRITINPDGTATWICCKCNQRTTGSTNSVSYCVNCGYKTKTNVIGRCLS